MRQQRRLVDPGFGKHQPKRVFTIDMHVVSDAARLGAGPTDMVEADLQQLGICFRPGDNVTGNENYVLAHSFCIAW